MEPRQIDAFIRSICNTFETMCNLKVVTDRPARKRDDAPLTDVSSVTGFSGDAVGCVVLHFSFDMASKIASAFTGEDMRPQHPDFADAIGELANMVAGGAKGRFGELNIAPSLPTVIVGRNHNVSAPKATPRIVIPCKTVLGTFEVEVGMVLHKKTASSCQSETAGVNP